MSLAKRILSSIWFRFTLGYALLFSLTLIFLMALTLWLGERYFMQQLDARVAAEARFLLFEYQEGGLAELLEEIEERLERRTANAPLIYSLKNADDVMIFDQINGAVKPGWQTLATPESASSGNSPRQSRFYSKALEGGYLFSVGTELTSVDDFSQALRRAGLWAFVFATAISIATGLMFARYYAAQIRHVIQGLRCVAAGHFEHRIKPKSRAYEFVQLSDELNRMISQLQRLMGNLQHITQGLAHDLRTPLAILSNHIAEAKAESKAGDQGALEKAELDVDNILAHFDSALLLAEIESGSLVDHFTVFDVSQLVHDMLETYEPLFEDRNIEVRHAFAIPLQLSGLPHLMTRAISNIFDNVIAHSGENSTLNISLKGDKKQEIVLHIRSHYSSQPRVYDGALVSESFATRVPPATSTPPLKSNDKHAGLGLRIIRAIVELHQGQFSTRSSPASDDNGACFEYQISFPAAHGQNAKP